MKRILCFWGCMLAVCAANAAGRMDAPRASIAPRTMVGTAHLNDFKSSLKFIGENIAAPDTPVPVEDTPRDTRDAERVACMSNNGWGMGNTFVWASKFSNTGNYSTMVEDVENPENNVCWVLVGLRSNDGRVNMSDMPTKYFEMGTNITCGSWVDESLVEKRILDAKKSARTLATVAGSVGGAGIGVGAMELFGNRALASAGVTSVQGQKALSDDELFISQLKELKNSDVMRYSNVVSMLKELKKVCGSSTQPDCNKVDYDEILTSLDE